MANSGKLSIIGGGRNDHVHFEIIGTKGRLWGDADFIGEAFLSRNLSLQDDQTEEVFTIVLRSDGQDGMAAFDVR
jgi:hypothetical protein